MRNKYFILFCISALAILTLSSCKGKKQEIKSSPVEQVIQPVVIGNETNLLLK